MDKENTKKNLKIDLLWKTISRLDTQYSNTNVKATILSAYYVFIISSIILKYKDILPEYCVHPIIYWILSFVIVIITFTSLIALFFTFQVVHPYRKSYYKQNNYSSNIFFEHICLYGNPDDFRDKIYALSEKDIETDIINQIYSLALGLSKKFQKLSIVVKIIIFLQLPLLLITAIIKIIFIN